MTDARVREAERRWQATGSLEDEAAWLRERVRSGELPEARLRLASYVGHRAATQAHVGLAPPPPAYVQAWIYGLEPWGAEACLRAAIAAARAALLRLPPDAPRGRAARAFIAGVERQVLGREPDHRPWDPHLLDDDPGPEERSAFQATVELVEGADEVRRATPETSAVAASARAGAVVWCTVEALDEAAVRAAVRDEVAPWALGTGDPLRMRMASTGEIPPEDDHAAGR